MTTLLEEKFDIKHFRSSKSIFDVEINAADGTPNLLQKHKGKVVMIVNTTVGCGNANQLEVLQWLQRDYEDQGFSIIGVPTNDYCGPGITRGKWSEGITCGADSQNYGIDVYGTTFDYTEMTSSNPNDAVSGLVGAEPGHNGLGVAYQEPHELWKTVGGQCNLVHDENGYAGKKQGFDHDGPYYSWWLNFGFDNGSEMGGNYEKYLFDKDGYLISHFNCQILTLDHEKTLKDTHAENATTPIMAQGRTKKVFEEEYAVVKEHIEAALAGQKSVINPNK